MEEPNNQEEFSNDSSQKNGTENEAEENLENITSENNNSNSETHLEPTENPKEGNTNASSAGNELSLICQEDISNDSVISETNLEVVNTKVAQKIKKRKSHSKEEPEKPTCKHESNNFKIIKRRFRCADCGAIACPECLVVASMTLHRHLHSADSDNDYKIFPCNLCDLYFLSQCSLQAHTRIHMLDSPYVCPDCGCIYSNIYYLSLHLINKCYHVYKVMKFRCSICQYTFKSADTFSDHIRNVHIKSIVVCSDCGSMFDDIDYFEKHALCSHNNAQVEKELFIRCTLCVSSAMPKSLEGDHINYHREHSVSHQFMYICPCGSNHNTMTSFRGHLQSCKKKKVLPAHWNFLQTKIKAQEVKNLNLKKDDKEETCFPDSPDSGICNNCGEELVDSEVATCKKCLEKEPENHKPSLEILQNSDIVVIKLNDDNNGNEIQPEYLENETENVNRDLKNEEESMEVIYLEDENKDSSKVVYNHVPNDHLGYLKTSGNNKIGHFQTETILDEETGILKSSKFWIGKERKGEEMQGIRVQNSGTTTTTYADYKKKNKDSFFSCPFCSTLFFKHESSFQKFLLHVECYHNDAGMDIEADKDDVLNQKKPLIVIRSDEESEEEESPPQPETNSQKPEIFRPRVIHEDDKKSQNMTNLPKKKRITLLKITTSPVKKSTDFFPEEKKTEIKSAVKSLNFQTESKKLNGVTENLSELSTPSKKVSDTEENKLNDSNDSSINKEEDSETSMSSRSLRKKRTSDETPKKDHEVWDEFYASLKIAEKYKFKKKKSAESVDDAEKVSVVSDYSSKRVVKKPKRFMISSGDESDEYSETEKEKEKINTLKISDSPEKEKTETDSVTKKINDQKFVESLFNFVEKKEKQIDLYKKHSELRLNPPPKDYRKGVLNGIKIRGRPKKFVPFNERSVLKSLPQPSPSKIKKRGRPRKPSSSSERISDYDKEVNFIEKNFETEDKDGAKRKRKLSTKIQFYQKMSSDTAEFSSGQLINNKIGINKKFTCAMCKDTYPNVTEFREHIIGHRADENTYQCMECGEIFVVRPSLVKHLHAFHKIKDIDKYIVENNCTLSENEKVEEPEPLKENQCKVCKDQFDSPGDLSKHFRVHGMAFLKEVKKETQKEEMQRKEVTRKGTGNVGNF